MQVQEWIQDHKDKLIQIIELEDVKSKSDPCEQPYKSQYAARDILQECITDIDEKMKNKTIEATHLSNFVYFCLSYRLGNNFINTEEKHSGEEIIQQICDKMENISQLKKFVDELPDKVSGLGDAIKTNNLNEIVKPNEQGGDTNSSDTQCIKQLGGILCKIYNTLGMLWASKILLMPDGDIFDDTGIQNSIKYLGRAKCLYKKYKCLMKTGETIDVKSKVDFDLRYEGPECLDSFLLNEINYATPYLQNECNIFENMGRIEGLKIDVFESDYTTTLFLLAQTFGKMSNKSYFKHKSARYCYWTLSRQLNALKYDPVEWSINAATLSQYFVTEKAFKRARHCIAAAEVIMKEAVQRPTAGPKEAQKKNETKSTTESEQSKNEEIQDEKLISKVTTESESTSNNELDCSKTIDGIFNDAIDKLVDDIHEKSNLNKIDVDDDKNQSEMMNLNETDESETKENGQNEILNSDDSQTKKKHLLPDPMSVSRLWDDDVYEEKREQGTKDIDRCWINYGNTLLEISAERMLPSYNKASEKDLLIIEHRMEDFNLEVSHIEQTVTCDWVTAFDDARELFLFIQRKIRSAQQFYKIDYRCSDYIELVMDHSKAFKGISNFEPTIERKCCMMKKRIDMYNELLAILNQEYYLIACRKMMLEIGEIYNGMMMLKMSAIDLISNEDESIKIPSSAKIKAQVVKMKKLAITGLEIYERFLETYRNRQGIIPEVFSEEDVRPVLIGHFYMARLYSKILEPDPKQRINNLRNSLEHYKYIANYCDKHDNAAQQMSAELSGVRDMVILLPCKIDKIISTMS